MNILYYNLAIDNRDGSGIHSREFLHASRNLKIKFVAFPSSTDRIKAKKPASLHTFIRHFPPVIVDSLVMVRALFRFGFNMIRLLPKIREYSPSLILARSTGVDPTPRFLANCLKVPLIMEVNSPLAAEMALLRPLGKTSIYHWEESEQRKHAHHFIVVSKALREYLVKQGVPGSNITVNPNGVDTRRFTPAIDGSPIRKRYGITKQFVVGFSGGAMPWHGVDILLDAIEICKRDLHDIVLLMIGKGWNERILVDKTNKLGISDQVVFIGQVHHDEVPRYLAACDVLVAPYPKIGFFYFSPLKIFEYMASAKPIIASSQGQIIELLGDRCGVLVEPGKADILADALLNTHNTYDEAILMGARAREKVEQFYTWNQNVQRVIGVCESVENV